MKKKNLILYSRRLLTCLLFVILAGNNSCRKFISISPPPTQLVSSTVFTTNQTANAAIVGLYSQIMSDGYSSSFASGAITIYTGLSGDELENFSINPNQSQFFANALNPTNSIVLSLWGDAYKYIYTCNAIIEGLNSPQAVTGTDANQVKGEALFLRAFCYFYLTNLFGDVPLVTATDYQSNRSLGKSDRITVYQKITADLQTAIPLLATDYSFTSGQRVRATVWAARALLARVELYSGNWEQAETEADSIINNGLFSLDSLDEVYLANSNESILQFMPVIPGYDTWEGNSFILTGTPFSSPGQVAMTAEMVNSFEENDQRRIHWVDSINTGGINYYFPYKYKVQTSSNLTEYYIVLRVAEQFLIRSEARAMMGNLNAAANDLNIIRNRAGLPNTLAVTREQILSAIYRERRVELFCEWGNRWLDHKRTGSIDSVMSVIKPVWSPKDTLYPMPVTEIQNDPNLTQNQGY